MIEVFQHWRPTALEDDLKAILASSLGSNAGTIRVSVQGAKVLLRGVVPSYAEKTRAELSLRAAGYTEVDNCVRVVPTINAMFPAMS